MDHVDGAALAGARLRAARESAGLSLSALAARIPYSKAALGHYETGFRVPSAEVQLWYARVCGDITDPVTAVSVLGRADVGRRAFLRRAAYSAAFSATALTIAQEAAGRVAAARGARRTGIGEVDALRTVTDAFARLDEYRGGGAGRTAVAEFLSTDVAALLRSPFASSAVRAEAFSAAAELAYLAGFKAHDAGMDGMAQRYYMSALGLAEASGVPGQDGWVLRVLALQGTEIGHSSFSAELAAEAARRVRGKVSCDTEALFTSALARCHAETGNTREARAILANASSWTSSGAPAGLPRWCAWWCGDGATVSNQTAKAYRALAEYGAAEEYHRLATSKWDGDVHRRVYALTMTDVGMARWQQGDPGGAADIWASTAPVLREIQSNRATQALATIVKLVPHLGND